MFIEFPVTGHVTLNFLLFSILKFSALKYFFHLNFDFVVPLAAVWGGYITCTSLAPPSISPGCAKLGI